MKRLSIVKWIAAFLMITGLMFLTGCAKTDKTGNPTPTAPAGNPTPTAAITNTLPDATKGADEATAAPTVTEAAEKTGPYTEHGALSVDGTNLVDSSGEPYQLLGMSTHGIAWFPQFVNYDSFKTLRDDWKVNCVRLAMYTGESGGYCMGGDRDFLEKTVSNGVDYATKLGLYVIIDWHILRDNNPNLNKEDSIAFFKEMSGLYKDNGNVIYEICNEPNGSTTWEDIKSYANEVIPVIRANDEDAVIIVGTPTWSQDIDKAAAAPLDFDNVLYALHFYAATHTDWLRQRLESCVSSGLPVFVSEFGMCDASGRGNNNFDETTKWLELLDKNQISYMCWSLANKNETCSVISISSAKISGWEDSDLSEAGQWIRNWFRSKTSE